MGRVGSMFQQDFIMREVELISRFLAKTLLGKDMDQEDEAVSFEYLSENYLLYRLRKLVGEGKINEAENELFELIESEPKMEYLSAAFEFYRTLSELDPLFLKQSDFSEDEILEGLSDIKRIYGIKG